MQNLVCFFHHLLIVYSLFYKSSYSILLFNEAAYSEAGKNNPKFYFQFRKPITEMELCININFQICFLRFQL